MASHSLHDHQHRGAPRAFFWAVVLNSAFSGLQLAIGIGFGSLALILMAAWVLHLLTDAAVSAAMLISAVLVGLGAAGEGPQCLTRRRTQGHQPR